MIEIRNFNNLRYRYQTSEESCWSSYDAQSKGSYRDHHHIRRFHVHIRDPQPGGSVDGGTE